MKKKKIYTAPQYELIDVTDDVGMLCISTPIDGDASEPADAPAFEDWY